MDRRLLLQELLEQILGSENVYFQPPENLSMVYPCIVYERDFADVKRADNIPYDTIKRYLVTYMDRNPDSPIPGKIGALPLSAFNRFFTSDGLNHDVYYLYY